MDFIDKKWNQIYQNQNRITEYYKCLYSVNCIQTTSWFYGNPKGSLILLVRVAGIHRGIYTLFKYFYRIIYFILN